MAEGLEKGLVLSVERYLLLNAKHSTLNETTPLARCAAPPICSASYANRGKHPVCGVAQLVVWLPSHLTDV